MTSRILFSFIFLCILGGTPVRAAEPVARIQGMLLNADEMFRDTEADTVELAGHVQIVSQERHVQADRAHVSLRSRQVELTGNVRLSTPTATITGDRILLDYESNTGAIYNGSVQSGPIVFEGALIQKTGPDDYFVVDADYTSCTNCPATWSFHGSTIRAQLGGYAYMKNSWFRVGDLSVFWLPYLVVPLKSDRQSGLLTPGFEQSRDGGLALAQPYFWAIDRSSDATITAKNYELRGPKLLGEYRYALPGAETNGGEFDGAIMRDRVFGDKLAHNEFHKADGSTSVERWYVHYKHYAEIENGWVTRLDVNNASDIRYPQDFPLETMNLGDTAMETRMSVTKNSDASHFSIDSSYYKNMLAADPTAGNEDSVHRVPEIRYAQVPQEIASTGLFYSLNFDSVNFTRSGSGFDNVRGTIDQNGNRVFPVDNTCIANSNPADFGNRADCTRVEGVYQKRDGPGSNGSILRTGQRLVFEPTITMPFSLGDYADVLPALSFNETHYSFPVGDQPNYESRYFRVDIGTRTRFSHVYGDLDDVKGTRYKHEIRPEIRYRGIPHLDRQDNAFFGRNANSQNTTQITSGLTDADLANPGSVQFDYNDQIYDKSRVTYMVTNTITEKKWVNEKPVYNQLALVQLAQTYDADIDSYSDPNKEPWSDISALVDLRFEHWQSNSQLNYFPYQKVWKSASYLRYKDDLGRFVQVGLNRVPNVVAGQPANYATRTEDWIIATGFLAKHVNFMGMLTMDTTKEGGPDPHHHFGIYPVKSWGYIAQFKPPGDCWLISLTHSQLVGSDMNIQLGFEFNFDGTPKKPLGPEELGKFSF